MKKRINGCTLNMMIIVLINAGMRNKEWPGSLYCQSQLLSLCNLCLKGYSELLEKGAWVNLQESFLDYGWSGHTEVAKLLLE